MPLTRFVRLTTQAEGLHRWPAAPEPENYLRARHRHLFVAEVDIEVFHDDREIEINAAARWLDTLLPGFADQAPAAKGGPLDFGTRSCEQLAIGITTAIRERYSAHRAIRCAVLEDGRLGGVAWQPDPTP
ncbi:hypothetical protein [Streptomyces sp. URMC 129]|uniref:hypothetical protein n=1 Tax=Streptomyces sp. URMC 129 TaxID=3423407 RepID=UPI003F19B23B